MGTRKEREGEKEKGKVLRVRDNLGRVKIGCGVGVEMDGDVGG